MPLIEVPFQMIAMDLIELRTLAQAGNNLTEFKSTLRKVLKLRVPGTLEHTQVKQAIVNHFEDLGGWDVSLDKFDEETVLGKKSFSNIIVTLNPSVDRRLVLACHYDTKFYASSPEGKQFLGATDSAVSCAILMELAKRLDKYLKAPNIQKEVTLQMVFFDGEEAFLEWTATDSLYGSRHLAALWQNTTYPPGSDTTMLSGIDDLVLLDLLGARHPSIYNFFSDTSDIYNQLMDIEKRLSAEELTARVSPYFVGSAHSPIFVEDDHVPFLEKVTNLILVVCQPAFVNNPRTRTRRNSDTVLTVASTDFLTMLFIIFSQFLYWSGWQNHGRTNLWVSRPITLDISVTED
uniref:glutaminyl-peptide cyclotransferase n=1 Tax=Saccoglossus kowalevskii TaxID=10224 RepID=A0ABM0MYZ2_SACKO|nr:PREDICTED: glutaminyl-peptide cyclotransferase-like [Saccoglossus kowalevskii]